MCIRDSIDTVMFSINPVYDYGQGEFGIGGADDRQAVSYTHLDVYKRQVKYIVPV